MTAYDMLIRNARICDGLGGPLVTGDVAITNGRIAEIGQISGTAAETVDARGLVLAPGIVDSHTHYDAQVTWDPWVDPSARHGVTTVVIGNCGFTIAPCRAADRELTMQNLVRVEGMSLDALKEGTNWEFESFSEFMDVIESGGTGVNVAAFVGHSSVRTYVMGDDAPVREANDDEIARMRKIVLDAMSAGAVGFSTSTSISHNGAFGPMPSRLAGEQEITELVSALGDAGRGVFMLTKGPASTIPYLESLAEISGRPVLIAALLHNSTRPEATFDDLASIAQARTRGHELWGQVSCCPLTTEFTLENPYPLEGIDSWKPAMLAEANDVAGILAAPDFRKRVKDDLKTAMATRLFNGEWDKVRVVEAVSDAYRSLEGQTIAQIAKSQSKDPLDCMLDISIDENLKTLFVAELLNSDEEAVGKMLKDPNSLITLSDAGAHLTFFCDAGFGLRLLGHWVRDRKLMPLETAIAQLTSVPADIFGITDRGRIAPGAWADLMLFDPDSVDRSSARRAFDMPAGSYRLTTDPVGLEAVWVNGERVVTGGELVDAKSRPGKLLREFSA